MHIKKIILLLALAFSTQSLTAGTLGAGSSGGGQSIGGFLRDLDNGMARPSCEKGKQFIKNLPSFFDIVEILESGNYDFGQKVLAEAKRMSICMSNKRLNSQIPQNQDGVFASTKDYKQVAIRVDSKNTDKIQVFIDEKEYKQMNEIHRSFLMLHEVMHSYLKKDPQVTYINRLWFFISDIYLFYKKDITPSPEEIRELFETYNIAYTSNLEALKSRVRMGDLEGMKKIFPQVNTPLKASLMLYEIRDNNTQDVFRFLKSKGADVNYFRIFSAPLHTAIKTKNFMLFKLLIDNGANESWIIDFQRTSASALKYTIQRGREKKEMFHVKVIEYLLGNRDFDEQEIEEALELNSRTRNYNKNKFHYEIKAILTDYLESNYESESRDFHNNARRGR